MAITRRDIFRKPKQFDLELDNPGGEPMEELRRRKRREAYQAKRAAEKAAAATPKGRGSIQYGLLDKQGRPSKRVQKQHRTALTRSMEASQPPSVAETVTPTKRPPVVTAATTAAKRQRLINEKRAKTTAANKAAEAARAKATANQPPPLTTKQKAAQERKAKYAADKKARPTRRAAIDGRIFDPEKVTSAAAQEGGVVHKARQAELAEARAGLAEQRAGRPDRFAKQGINRMETYNAQNTGMAADWKAADLAGAADDAAKQAAQRQSLQRGIDRSNTATAAKAGVPEGASADVKARFAALNKDLPTPTQENLLDVKSKVTTAAGKLGTTAEDAIVAARAKIDGYKQTVAGMTGQAKANALEKIKVAEAALKAKIAEVAPAEIVPEAPAAEEPKPKKGLKEKFNEARSNVADRIAPPDQPATGAAKTKKEIKAEKKEAKAKKRRGIRKGVGSIAKGTAAAYLGLPVVGAGFEQGGEELKRSLDDKYQAWNRAEADGISREQFEGYWNDPEAVKRRRNSGAMRVLGAMGKEVTELPGMVADDARALYNYDWGDLPQDTMDLASNAYEGTAEFVGADEPGMRRIPMERRDRSWGNFFGQNDPAPTKAPRESGWAAVGAPAPASSYTPLVPGEVSAATVGTAGTQVGAQTTVPPAPPVPAQPAIPQGMSRNARGQVVDDTGAVHFGDDYLGNIRNDEVRREIATGLYGSGTLGDPNERARISQMAPGEIDRQVKTRQRIESARNQRIQQGKTRSMMAAMAQNRPKEYNALMKRQATAATAQRTADAARNKQTETRIRENQQQIAKMYTDMGWGADKAIGQAQWVTNTFSPLFAIDSSADTMARVGRINALKAKVAEGIGDAESMLPDGLFGWMPSKDPKNVSDMNQMGGVFSKAAKALAKYENDGKRGLPQKDFMVNFGVNDIPVSRLLKDLKDLEVTTEELLLMGGMRRAGDNQLWLPPKNSKWGGDRTIFDVMREM